VAPGSDGSFVVVWGAFTDGDYGGIFARRFDAFGAPLTGELLLNTYTTRRPGLAGDLVGSLRGLRRRLEQQHGRLVRRRPGPPLRRRRQSSRRRLSRQHVHDRYSGVAACRHERKRLRDRLGVVSPASKAANTGQDGDKSGIFGQLYDANGNPFGGEFQVNVYTTGHQIEPAVAMDPSGGFLVVWDSLFAQDPSGSDVLRAPLRRQRKSPHRRRSRQRRTRPDTNRHPDVGVDAPRRVRRRLAELRHRRRIHGRDRAARPAATGQPRVR
jgi:hypothetical protein